MDIDIYTLVVLPLLIFLARALDVTLDTVRIIFVARGRKFSAAALGFCSVIIWLFAISQALKHLSHPIHAIAFAGGFALGNFVGISLESRLAFGQLVMRIITGKDSKNLIHALREEGYPVTVVDAHGAKGAVKLLFMVIARKNLQQVSEKIRLHNPQAFVSIEDVRVAGDANLASMIHFR